ncbi:hypothetical protein [Methylomarinum vadi]|uniref:hypothetical protein n=1 Tax=Methylomarinum vadi TaxID=438855 RepID=UPI0004DECDBA|nr:hypothetical protein [Methylomarinum vadi]
MNRLTTDFWPARIFQPTPVKRNNGSKIEATNGFKNMLFSAEIVLLIDTGGLMGETLTNKNFNDDSRSL